MDFYLAGRPGGQNWTDFFLLEEGSDVVWIRKVLRTWVREHSVRESREQSIGFLSPRNGAPSNLTKSNSNGFQYEINLSVKGRS